MRISLHFLSYILGALALLLTCRFLNAQEIDKGNTVPTGSGFKAHLVDRLPMGSLPRSQLKVGWLPLTEILCDFLFHANTFFLILVL